MSLQDSPWGAVQLPGVAFDVVCHMLQAIIAAATASCDWDAVRACARLAACLACAPEGPSAGDELRAAAAGAPWVAPGAGAAAAGAKAVGPQTLRSEAHTGRLRPLVQPVEGTGLETVGASRCLAIHRLRAEPLMHTSWLWLGYLERPVCDALCLVSGAGRTRACGGDAAGPGFGAELRGRQGEAACGGQTGQREAEGVDSQHSAQPGGGQPGADGTAGDLDNGSRPGGCNDASPDVLYSRLNRVEAGAKRPVKGPACLQQDTRAEQEAALCLLSEELTHAAVALVHVGVPEAGAWVLLTRVLQVQVGDRGDCVPQGEGTIKGCRSS